MTVSTTSPWLDESPPQVTFPTLTGQVQCDVVVIGGGMHGMLTAYTLAKHGVSVILLEKSSIGTGESGYTTAFLTQVIDLPLPELTERYGTAGAKELWTAGNWAVRQFEGICAEEHIVCDLLRCPALVFAQDHLGEIRLKAEVKQAEQLGVAASWEQDHLQFKQRGYMSVPDQAKFHPRKFLSGLSQTIVRRGGQVFEKTKALKLTVTPEKTYEVTTKLGSVVAQRVVVCTHQPQLLSDVWTAPLTSWQTYAIEAQVPTTVLPEALFWDTAVPYHYFRVDRMPKQDRIILGGEDHLMERPIEHNPHQALETYLTNLFPDAPFNVTKHWGGQILETPDGLPLIGALNPEHSLLVGTGFSGNGMTFSLISAHINTHLVLHGKHAWKKWFDPLRFKST